MQVKFYTNKLKEKYKIAILMKDSALSLGEAKKYYLPHIEVKDKDIVLIGLTYDAKRVSAKHARSNLENNIYPICKQLGVRILLVTDSQYFKFITNKPASTVSLHYAHNVHPNYDKLFKVIPIPNYQGFFFNPDARKDIELNLSALPFALNNMPIMSTSKCVMSLSTPHGVKAIRKALRKLHTHRKLAIDIEAFSLEQQTAGIGTISFSWSKSNSLAMFVDYLPRDVYEEHYSSEPIIQDYPDTNAVRIDNKKVKRVLKKFIIEFKNTWIYHNKSYDAKILIYELFMNKDPLNREGLLTGLIELCNNSEDTQVITYLANNSCSKPMLNLKTNTIEYMGNYGIDVTDITTQDPYKLLHYNGEDTIATYYLFNKNFKFVKKYNMEYLYHTIFKEMAITQIQCELEGMCLKMSFVKKLNKKLNTRAKEIRKTIARLPAVQAFEVFMQQRIYIEQHKKWKTKTANFNIFNTKDNKFNPGSSSQLVMLIHKFLGVPVFDVTHKKNPATDKDAKKKLIEYLTYKVKNK